MIQARKHLLKCFLPSIAGPSTSVQRCLHVFRAPDWDITEDKFEITPEKWKYYNQIVWPPGHTLEDGTPKHAEVFHCRENVKHSPHKLWYSCKLVLNLTIEQALKQLEFTPRKGAKVLAEVLTEAQEMAVKDHNFEYRSNMWVAEAFGHKSMIIRGQRRHARNRWGSVEYVYCNVFVRLQEGSPPNPDENMKVPRKRGWQQMEDYLKELRDRKILSGI